MSEGGAGQTGAQTQARLAITLRNGASCELRADRLVIGGPQPQEFPLADVAWAGLVIDPGVPATPGAPPPPAVLLRLRDARDVLLSPAESPAAWQLLGAIFQARPDLRAAAGGAYPPPPPGPGYAPGYPPGYTPGYGPGYMPGYGPAPVAGPSSNDTVLAGLAHLGVFLGGWLLPLIIWLTTRRSAPYASQQAKQAFFWQLGFFVLFILAYIAFFAIFFVGMFSSFAAYPTGPSSTPPPFPVAPFGSLFAFYGVVIVGGIVNMVFSIIGAVNAFQGKPFHYPLLGWV